MSNPTESIFTNGFVELISKSEESFMSYCQKLVTAVSGGAFD